MLGGVCYERGTVWGLPRYERCEGLQTGSLADNLNVNERDLIVIHSCGGGIHISCNY